MRLNLYLQYTDKPKFEGVLTSPQKNNSAYNDGGSHRKRLSCHIHQHCRYKYYSIYKLKKSRPSFMIFLSRTNGKTTVYLFKKHHSRKPVREGHL